MQISMDIRRGHACQRSHAQRVPRCTPAPILTHRSVLRTPWKASWVTPDARVFRAGTAWKTRRQVLPSASASAASAAAVAAIAPAAAAAGLLPGLFRARPAPQSLPNPPSSSALPQLMPWLLSLAISERRMRWRLVLSLMCMVVSKAAGLTCPMFLKRAVDSLSTSGGGIGSAAVQACVVALACYGLCDILRNIAKELQGPTFTPVAQAVGRRVAYHTFAHVLDLDIKFHLDRRTGRLSRILERGTRSLQLLYRTLVFTFLPTLMECVIVCCVLGTTFSPVVALLVGAAFTLYITWTLALTQLATEARKQVNELDNLTTSKAVDALLNYETVALFDNQKLEVKDYDQHLQGFQRASVRTEQLAAILNGGQAVILAIGLTSVLATVVWLGGTKAATSAAVAAGTAAVLSAGDLVLVQGLVMQLWSPLQFLGWFYRELRSSIVDLEEFFQILRTRSNLEDGVLPIPDLRPTPRSAPIGANGVSSSSSSSWDAGGSSSGSSTNGRTEPPGAVLAQAAADAARRASGALAATSNGDRGLDIQLVDVKFGYGEDREILHGINLHIEPGQSVAVVGSSGSGKSTILKLATRLYDCTSGKVLVNGADVRALRLADLRQAVAVVPQDTVLFNDTILNNIRYGRPDASDEDVMEASRMARLDAAVLRMSEGYATVVGERGLKLSGGEKQRVAIARAFLRAPRLLICDEATSALDSATERQIMDSLEQLARGRTSIFVAHRLSTIRNCDKIVVLREGRVVEEGSHEDLMERDGVYTAMWNLQASEESVGAEALPPCTGADSAQLCAAMPLNGTALDVIDGTAATGADDAALNGRDGAGVASEQALAQKVGGSRELGMEAQPVMPLRS